jgi:predicted amidohydrolase
MSNWKIACVQMDCRLADRLANLAAIRSRFADAVAAGAQLVVFPECAISGYCYDSKGEAWPHAEPIPGPSTEAIGIDCRKLGAWAVFGLLERVDAGDQLFNACALVGPRGLAAVYRKIHRPYLGVDRFTTPGDRPFAVHDLGGLRVGMNICYDGSFPESARVLALLGADLIVLPTNWPPGAINTARYLVPARALENNVYYAAVNRVGDERGFHFIGHTRIVDCHGEFLASSDGDREQILYAEINPERARAKQVVTIPGKYEVNRIADRRPEMYGLLSR